MMATLYRCTRGGVCLLDCLATGFAERSLTGFCQSPRALYFATWDGNSVHAETDADLGQVYEARFFDTGGELRWLRDPQTEGFGTAAWVSEDGCDLRLMVASDDNTEDEIIRKFEMEFESKTKECAVLIVRAPDDSERWTLAGFSDAGEFRTVVIDDPSHELSKELKKEPNNQSRIVELATSSLGRTREDDGVPVGFDAIEALPDVEPLDELLIQSRPNRYVMQDRAQAPGVPQGERCAYTVREYMGAAPGDAGEDGNVIVIEQRITGIETLTEGQAA